MSLYNLLTFKMNDHQSIYAIGLSGGGLGQSYKYEGFQAVYTPLEAYLNETLNMTQFLKQF